MDIKKIDRIFIFAITLSVAFHVFWLFALTVVVVPSRKAPIKFSKVAFLGPVLERGMIDVRVAPKARSILEKRYLSAATDVYSERISPIKDSAPKYDAAGTDIFISSGEKLASLIDGAVSGPKLEPSQLMD